MPPRADDPQNESPLPCARAAASLHRRDLGAFYAQAAEGAVHGSNLVLLDLGLQQIVNTLVPYGTALPRSADPETALRAIASKSPQVSDLFIGAVAGNLRLN